MNEVLTEQPVPCYDGASSASEFPQKGRSSSLDTSIYEQPLNERMRIFLRLEHLSSDFYAALENGSAWDSRHAISALLDLLTVAERNDIKSECLKELDRHSTRLNRLSPSPLIQQDKLGAILHQLSEHTESIQKLQGKVGQRLRDNEFLSSIRQRLAIPGGTCGFDLPAYHHWLTNEAAYRRNVLQEWFAEFGIIMRAVSRMLALTREGATCHTEHAPGGFYQKAFENQFPCQMVRVSLPASSLLFPEISAGKHRVHIRFLQPKHYERPVQYTEEVTFGLACCF